MTDPDTLVATVVPPRIEVEEEPVVAEGEELEGEGAEEGADGEGPAAEGGDTAEGESPSQE
jgi:hypothetical protein